jgi:zinc/manganese transport system ATP-binding protein
MSRPYPSRACAPPIEKPDPLMTAISCTRATIALGGRTILKEIDLEIGERELIGVLGPNGAGKTTLLRAILGLVPVVSGDLRVFGTPPTRGNAMIGYMPQNRIAPDGIRLCGRDIVGLAARGERWGLPWSGAEARANVEWALDRVDAVELAKRPMAALSGGERQRLLLAQALLGRPKLLLLDEPLVNLDPRHQAAMVQLVREVQQHLAITVLFCTHEINPLLGALDRVLYLGGGGAALGSVEQVIESAALSRLYGASIDVIRHNGRIFVMSGDQALDDTDHGDHAESHHAPV